MFGRPQNFLVAPHVPIEVELCYIFNMLTDFVIRVLAIIGLTILIVYLVRRFRQGNWSEFLKLALFLPGPRAYPFIGNALEIACESKDLLLYMLKTTELYGKSSAPIRIWIGPILCLVVSRPQDLEVILNSQQATLKGFIYDFLKPVIGEGLISGSGPRWKLHRKLVSHILTQKTLDKYLEIFRRQSQNLVEGLKSSSNGTFIDILKPLDVCSMASVIESVMGCPIIESFNNLDHELLDYSHESYQAIHNRMKKIWLYPDWIYKFTKDYKLHLKSQNIIHAFIWKCISEAEKRREVGSVNSSILDSIMNIREKSDYIMSREELVDEIVTLYFAAQDTIATISSFAILMLGIHQEIQKEARREVEQVLGDGPITPENITRLKYLEKVIKETLRLFPIAPILARTSLGKIKLDSCNIPEGCPLILLPFVTHRSKAYWTDPEKFNPGRFDLEEIQKRHPFSFIPFSAGPMNCIGQKYAMMSLKTIIGTLLQNFRINSKHQMIDTSLKFDISVRSANGYEVALESL